MVQHVLTADDTLMRLAVRYGSDEGAIMKQNNLLTSDLDFLPLRKVEKRLKTASDGTTEEVEVVVHEGTVLSIPVLVESENVGGGAGPSVDEQKRALEAEERS